MHLLRASAAPTLAEAAHLLTDVRGSQELLRCAADWLRLMVRAGGLGLLRVRLPGLSPAAALRPCHNRSP